MKSTNMLDHLAALIDCDSQNPPRAFDAEASMFRYCRERRVAVGFAAERSATAAGPVNQ